MSFQDIKGQDRAIQIIKESLAHARMASGYLFTGPEGVGKNLSAVTLAKAVNCLQSSSDACGRCTSCMKIIKNQHPDIHFIGESDYKESETSSSGAIKIEHIRQLQREINLRPYEGRRKVFIINNAHNLTPEASNALLKILEEPPSHSLIILITSRQSLLFKTIISRCRIIKFSPFPRTKLEEILKKDYGLDNNFAHFLAYFSEGRLGLALRLKDADILRKKNNIIDEFRSPDNYRRVSSIEKREDLRNALNMLATWFRDIYLLKIGMPHSELINLDRRDELLKHFNRYSFDSLEEIMNSISDSIVLLEQNINVRLLVSNLMWSMKG